MYPWVTVALLGIAIFGFAWLTPARRQEEAGGSSDPAYDQLLEELETENRELLDAVTQFKQDQDETVKNLAKQIQALEQQMNAMSEIRPTAASVAASSEPSLPDPIVPPSGTPQAEPSSIPNVPTTTVSVSSAAPAPIRERYADLLTQHRKGRSIEQIAKSAGMNKGEVQLILQLAKREEEQLG